jgi:hypothetical protein
MSECMEWIPIAQQNPPDHATVLVWAPDGHNQVKRLLCEAYHIGWGQLHHGQHSIQIRGVTHWMPLPEPPEEARTIPEEASDE